MKLHFLGANRQVTGSRYCLETGGQRFLVDCGLFQERPFLERNWQPSPLPPDRLDAVLLTHAHLDHCGLLPKLVADGFAGPIYATRPTIDLAEVILRDSADIQQEDAAYKRRRHAKEGRRGKHPEVPLYRQRDVDRTMRRFSGVNYRQPVQLPGGSSVVFHDAGHILGSAMLEFTVRENGREERVVFSGDIGQWDKPLIHDPTLLTEADYVIMESTYGDRNHEDAGDIETQLARVLDKTLRRGGNVVIPTFAVERSQELMYYISRLVHDDRIPDVHVFLDSPMAVDVTEIFRSFRDWCDHETRQLVESDQPPLRFPGLQLVRSVDESKAINRFPQPCIIMASSGMCTGGRIKHHLRQNISRPESTILFVGYQAEGTLGRQILDRQPQVRIHNRQFEVRADVAQIFGFSGHADRRGLLRWLGALRQPPRRVFLTHGEEEAALNLAQHIGQNMQWPVLVPQYREVVELNGQA